MSVAFPAWQESHATCHTWGAKAGIFIMQRRTIKAKEIVADIRAGMTYRELMDKYRVSLGKLQNIFRMLRDADAIQASELEPLYSIAPERLDAGKRRKVQRNYVFVRLPVYDMDNLLNEGIVVDITETGLRTSGLQVTVGETKGFLLQADYFAEVYPFTFEAQCIWVSTSEQGQMLAGFSISSITEVGLEELRKLIQTLTLSA